MVQILERCRMFLLLVYKHHRGDRVPALFLPQTTTKRKALHILGAGRTSLCVQYSTLITWDNILIPHFTRLAQAAQRFNYQRWLRTTKQTYHHHPSQ